MPADTGRRRIKTPHPLLQMLSGGDRRSIGQSNHVVSMVLNDPGLFPILFEGMDTTDPVLRMRCADAAEKVTAIRPEYLIPYKKVLIDDLSKVEQQEVRWHVAPMLTRLPLSKAEVDCVINILLGYTNDRSSIVKTSAMQSLADMALRSRRLCPEVLQHIRELTVIGTPAMRARGRKLVAKLSKACEN
jgi:hypothetical protein